MATEEVAIRVKVYGAEEVRKTFQNFSGVFKEVTNTSATSFAKMGDHITQFGRNMQWAGQRLTFGLSLPLYLFGNQAMDVFLSVNKSFTQLKRVWSGNVDEIELLKESAVRLSNAFGKTQEVVLDTYTELSKAGLGKNAKEMEELGKLALQTSSIFDVELSVSTDQIKSLMLTFGMSVDEVRTSIDAMNVIADKTPATEEGLIEALKRAGAVARPLDIDIRQLSAGMTILQGANVDVERAATALRTIFVRLTTASGVAKDKMRAFGIDMDDVNWKMLTGKQRLEILAKKFAEVQNSGDKVKFEGFRDALSTLIGGGRGGYLNELNLVLGDIGKSLDSSTESQSLWKQALDASADPMQNAITTANQMGVMFDSEAFKVEQAKQKYRNLQAEIGEKVIPIKLKLLEIMSKLIDKFNELTPAGQDFIIKALTLTVALGPVLASFGAIIQIVGPLIKMIGKLGGAIGWLVTNWDTIALVAMYAGDVIVAVLGAIATAVGAPVWVVVAAIGAIITAIVLLIKYWDEIKAWTIKTWNIIIAWMSGLPARFVTIFDSVKAKISEFITNAGIFFMQLPEKIAFALGYAAGKLWIFATQTIPNWFNTVVGWFNSLPEKIGNALNSLGGVISNKFRDALNWVTHELPNHIGIVLRWVEGIPERVKNALGSLGGAIADSFGDAFNWAIKELPRKIKGIADIGWSIAKSIGRAIRDALGALGGAFAAGWKSATGQELHFGGLVQQRLLKAQTGMIIPGSSPLRDRVPVMAEQGEGIMSKKAIENLLKNGVIGGGQQVTYNINFQPGVMIATPGEQRNFARKIKELIEQDNSRYIGSQATNIGTI
jgi:TP901 family phage tail tape measure protein